LRGRVCGHKEMEDSQWWRDDAPTGLSGLCLCRGGVKDPTLSGGAGPAARLSADP
jgi:hypothetical protein